MLYLYLLFISLFSATNSFKWNPFSSDYIACDMTYMWRYPNYMDVGFKHNFKGYSLWLYGEGYYVQNFMHTKKVNGLPVIFVPGNAGSGKQGRSLGSVLQNKTDLRNTNFHFDIFTVDYNEQYSGLSSSFLLKQADFLEAAVEHVWKMYEKPPPGIIFVSHSMGGIVVREVVKRPSFDLNKVSLVLTLATPHLKPPIIADSEMYKLWKDIETAWNESRITSSHVRVVSISSGLRDELISETLCRSPNPTVYHYVTTGIDRVWVEADHKCIVWCNQLVRHMSRLLFHYAENLSSFRENVDSIIKLFYSGVGATKKQISTKSNITDAATVCTENEPCVEQGIVSLSKSSDKIVLAIGEFSNYQLISSKQCSPELRYLNDGSFYSLVEAKGCNGAELIVNTNVSKLWIVNASQVHLKPLTLQSSLFQQAEARRFTVSKGIRRLKVSFSDVSPTSVFVVSLTRKCTKGDFRAVFEINGVQRFDEFLTKEKTQRIIRILSHSGESGELTFFDTEKCGYDIKIEQDWKNTVKLTLLEWVGTVPAITFACLIFYTFSALILPHGFMAFGVTGILVAGIFPMKIPYLICLISFIATCLIYHVSTWANAYLTRKVSQKSQLSLICNVPFIVACLALSLFLHPFTGALLAAVITSMQNRATPSCSSPFKLLFLLLISIPGVIYCAEVLLHSGDIHYPWDYFTLSSFFFILSSFLASYHHYRIPILCFATAIPFLWPIDFTSSYIFAVDFQTAIIVLIHAGSLRLI